MNLEQIDTSTTAGKAEVMRLAADGRRVAYSVKGAPDWMECPGEQLSWNWVAVDYAIISEPVWPEEVWCELSPNGKFIVALYQGGSNKPETSVRYLRADLAGEGK